MFWYVVGIILIILILVVCVVLASNKPKRELLCMSEIPKIIHQTAPTDPSKWNEIWKRCQETWKRLHPDFKYVMWTDEDIDAFVKTKYPEFYPMFSGYDVHIKRVDIVRYLILKEYGGIYADMDYECIRRFFELLPQDKVSIAESIHKQFEDCQNALMISPKGHPFWDVVMEIAKKRYDENDCKKGDRGNVLFCTGPQLIDEARKDQRIIDMNCFNKLPAKDYMDKYNNPKYALHHGTVTW